MEGVNAEHIAGSDGKNAMLLIVCLSTIPIASVHLGNYYLFSLEFDHLNMHQEENSNQQ